MQGYLFSRTIHNLLRTVLIFKRSEHFLLLEIGRTFPGRIFQKSFDVEEMGEIIFQRLFSALVQLSPGSDRQFEPMAMPHSSERWELLKIPPQIQRWKCPCPCRSACQMT